jgi:hypothetical protein
MTAVLTQCSMAHVRPYHPSVLSYLHCGRTCVATQLHVS